MRYILSAWRLKRLTFLLEHTRVVFGVCDHICVLVPHVWLFVYAPCSGLGYVHMQDAEAESLCVRCPVLRRASVSHILRGAFGLYPWIKPGNPRDPQLSE